jgi:tRNA(Arg) A34 adenosine deaminase TadA
MTKADLMSRAIELAIENVQAGRGGPFGAVVARDGDIIATGTNLVTSTNDPTAHAEIVAIREACRALRGFQLTGCEIFASCEPCPMCLGAVYWSRLDRVYIAASRAHAAEAGFDDDFIYAQLLSPPADRLMPMIEIAHPRALAPFDEWRLKENRISY